MIASYISAGDGPRIVLFLHGVGSGKEGWKVQLANVPVGWRFVAVDAPGFGDTPLPDQPGFEPHVSSLIALMNEMNISSAVICGHSLGGMTAQEVYAAHPERVDGLVLSATSPAFGKPDGDFQKEFLRARFEPFDNGMSMKEFAENFAANLMAKTADQQAIEEAIETMSQVSIPAYRLAMQTIVGFDQRANLGNISVPTMLVAGDSDTNAPAGMMKKMAGFIPAAEYVELSDTGHLAPIESAANFNKQLQAFLKRLD